MAAPRSGKKELANVRRTAQSIYLTEGLDMHSMPLIEIELTHPVLPLQGYNLRQGHNLPLHAVDALHNDQDLAPGPVCAWLTRRYAVSEQNLQVLYVVVPEHLHPACPHLTSASISTFNQLLNTDNPRAD